uniref:peptide-methionine (S)-S-oxide reductase n=1 Tax=Athene cunicularia TaxID=194338 RepID=A0A663MJW8_ATHCN
MNGYGVRVCWINTPFIKHISGCSRCKCPGFGSRRVAGVASVRKRLGLPRAGHRSSNWQQPHQRTRLNKHHVNGNRMVEPFPEGTQMVVFGKTSWAVTSHFWKLRGKTGHTEAVRVVYQPENISFEKLLKVFWENHDPTQGMRQGNDFGTQYRSAIYTFSQEQMEAALRSKEEYQQVTLGRAWTSLTCAEIFLISSRDFF